MKKETKVKPNLTLADFKVGQTWKTREGGSAYILRINPDQTCPLHVYIHTRVKSFTYQLYPTGKELYSAESGLDLVKLIPARPPQSELSKFAAKQNWKLLQLSGAIVHLVQVRAGLPLSCDTKAAITKVVSLLQEELESGELKAELKHEREMFKSQQKLSKTTNQN